MNEAIVPMLGADPELFLTKNRRKVPVFGLFGGSKQEPIQMQGLRAGFFFQEDGAALEFNIPPAPSPKDFAVSIRDAVAFLMIHAGAKGVGISRAKHMTLSQSELVTPAAQEIGCLADMCAYEGPDNRIRVPFQAADLGNTRFAGGHLHCQFDHRKIPKHAFVKLADTCINLLGVLADPQGERRKFYGLAGIYRDKPYGVELRTPSNFWVHGLYQPNTYSSAYMKQHDVSWRMVRSLFELMQQVNDPAGLDALGEYFVTAPWDDIRNCINTEDKPKAHQLIDHASKAGIPVATMRGLI